MTRYGGVPRARTAPYMGVSPQSPNSSRPNTSDYQLPHSDRGAFKRASARWPGYPLLDPAAQSSCGRPV
jgi:hypothetical protein